MSDTIKVNLLQEERPHPLSQIAARLRQSGRRPRLVAPQAIPNTGARAANTIMVDLLPPDPPSFGRDPLCISLFVALLAACLSPWLLAAL